MHLRYSQQLAEIILSRRVGRCLLVASPGLAASVQRGKSVNTRAASHTTAHDLVLGSSSFDNSSSEIPVLSNNETPIDPITSFGHVRHSESRSRAHWSRGLNPINRPRGPNLSTAANCETLTPPLVADGQRRKQPRGRMAPTGVTRERFYFQFITTPTSDTPGTTLLLHFDNKRYMFGNCPEGTQRACIERGIGLGKIRSIFLSGQVNWKNTGGLIGMILTLADGRAAQREAEKLRLQNASLTLDGPAKVESSGTRDRSALEEDGLTIHGGDHLLHTMACARKFVFRKGMPVRINEFEFPGDEDPVKPTWADENIRVWAMPIATCSPTTDHDSPGNADAALEDSVLYHGSSRRKRSHDEFSLEGHPTSKSNTITIEQAQQDKKLKQDIVNDMFNSEWNRDALFETRLEDVKMPAALFVRDAATKKITTYQGPKPGDGSPLPDIKVLVRNPWPGAAVEHLPDVRPLGFQPALSYIIQGYPQRGRFDLNKASALGVPRGPFYSSLAAGNAVTLENGRVVSPDMVLGSTKPGRGIAVVDLPSAKYVPNLINRPEWKNEALRAGITAICWILGPGVVSSSELQEFMASMPKVDHIVSSTDICPNYLALDSCAASAIRLSCISKTLFPVPFHDNVTVPQAHGGTPEKAQGAHPAIAAMRGLTIQVEPEFAIKRNEIAPLLNTALVVQALPQKVQEAAQLVHTGSMNEASAHGRDAANGNDHSSFDPEIITLGTGSSTPSKYRNVSATLLRTEKYGNLLFDCGESTLGQLQRVFDPPALQDVLRKLRFIWISHLHADHHLGTISVLAAHKLASLAHAQAGGETNSTASPPAKILVATERKMIKFLEEYQSIESFPNMKQLYCQPHQGPILNEDISAYLRQELGVSKLQTTGVDHCAGAQAISVTFQNGFKFSYSGDCRPSHSFAAIGKGSDVLVHEATFDDDMEGDALAKKHSTTGEALGVAAQMGAKNVMLTHFSQRYQKLPVMDNLKLPLPSSESSTTGVEDPLLVPIDTGDSEVAGGNTSTNWAKDPLLEDQKPLTTSRPGDTLSKSLRLNMPIGVAFDYMRVRVSKIKDLEKLKPALTMLFEAEKSTSTVEESTPRSKSDAVNRTKGGKGSVRSPKTRKDGARTGLTENTA